MAKKKDKKTMYILIGIIIVLLLAFAYVSVYPTKVTQPVKVTSDVDANKIQQNVTSDIMNIKGALEQLNRSLG
ncbi:hypothetical protein HYW99_01395 [Candidatus Woesearchaeota archaeon]|nr:hypothetical protein [Candidatus Aenigmarchaeota archaeon]MBI2647106.1 hypothetical protein [Candidatus Woesearchaeota archaeon]